MIVTLKNKYIRFNNYKVKCAIGKSGIKKNKREGDKFTPKGKFRLNYVLYRSDRVKKISTKLKKIIIRKKMGWCDDPRSKKYNQLIEFPFGFRAEKMYLKENTYDIVVVLNYNMKPVIPKKGSAIFLHLAKKNYSSTKGCIAISKKNMKLLLSNIKKKTYLNII